MATACLPLWEQKGSACFYTVSLDVARAVACLPDVSLPVQPADPVLETLNMSSPNSSSIPKKRF